MSFVSKFHSLCVLEYLILSSRDIDYGILQRIHRQTFRISSTATSTPHGCQYVLGTHEVDWTRERPLQEKNTKNCRPGERETSKVQLILPSPSPVPSPSTTSAQNDANYDYASKLRKLANARDKIQAVAASTPVKPRITQITELTPNGTFTDNKSEEKRSTNSILVGFTSI